MKKLIVVLILLISSAAVAQETLQQVCVYKGKPCPLWLSKIIGPYPNSPADSLFIEEIQPKPFKFWSITIGHPATTKKFLTSPWFIGGQAVAYGLTTWACRIEHSCHSELPAQAALSAIMFVSGKYIMPPMTLAQPAVDFHYIWEIKNHKY
jgi:hypothetical protein